MSAVLPTAQRLVVTQQTFFPFTQFTAANPAPNSGVHRFIYALYTQPPNFNTVGFQSVGMELQTANWNVSIHPCHQLKPLSGAGKKLTTK